jgi:hypothetical protein
MTSHRTGNRPHERRGLPAACSAVTALALGLICLSAGPVKLAGVLILLGAFVCAMWVAHQARFVAIAPAIGLALAFLILIGLALAVFHALNTDPIALAIGAITLAAAWASSLYPAAGALERRIRVKLPSPIAAGGIAIFAAAAVFAVHYSAVSATADSDGASSLAVWAYPSGGQLHVGARQPPGHGSTTLRIVVTHAGITAATWNDVRLAPGQTWAAPALTLTGNGPTRVVASHGGIVVASFSSSHRSARS